jgi:predicted ATPase
MLSDITLLNFKCFQRPTNISLDSFTLLSGINSRGKSTAIQPLLLMRQSCEIQLSASQLYLNGDYVTLGRYSDIRSAQASRSEPLEIGFRFSEGENNLSIRYQLIDNEQDDSVAIIDNIEVGVTSTGQTINRQWNLRQDEAGVVWRNLIPSTLALPTTSTSMVNWNNVHYISADRLGPQDFYLKHSFSDFIFVGTRGEHIGSVLHSAKQTVVRAEMCLETGVTQTVPDQAAAWLGRLFGEAHLDTQATDTNVLLLFLSSESSPSRLYRPSNVGFGYSYALPIIVTALVAQPGQIVIIENPEAHLHPYAQAQLIKMLIQLSQTGIQVIVETHSDHVLNAVRVAVSEALIEPGNLSVLFFEQHPEQYLRQIRLETDGMIDLADWPEGFFDQTERDFMRLYNQ